MKIKRKSPRFAASLSIKQFPWPLSKLIRFKRRKWLKIKFSTRFSNLRKTGRAFNFRFFKTYKKKIKKLFRVYFAPTLTERKCQKLFNLNARYKSTFQKVLKAEHRFDILVFRFYMLPDVALARELIKKNYFLLNNKPNLSTTRFLHAGDIISVSNFFSWQFLYQNMLKVVSSLIKYLNRLFFKFSFPFITKRQNFHIKEYGKFKERTLKFLNPKLLNRITTRNLFLRYKKVKETTTSKTKPVKKYYFKQPKHNENFKTKRLKHYILKKTKTNSVLLFTSKLHIDFDFFKPKKQIRYRKLHRQLEFIKKLSFLNSKLLKVKNLKKKSKNLFFLAKRLSYKKQSKLKKKQLKKRKHKILTTLNQIKSKPKKTKAIVLLKDARIFSFKKINLKFKQIPFISKKKAFISGKKTSFIGQNRASTLYTKKKKFYLLANNFTFNFLSRKTRHFQFLFNSQKKTLESKFSIQNRRPQKLRWRKWVPRSPKNFWQANRLTKKNLYLFRYLKKFNNKYKQYNLFQKLKQNSWTKISNFWQKTTFIFEKKRKRLLTRTTKKSVIYLKNKTKSAVFYKKHILNKKSSLVFKKEKFILRIKRKYLYLKGFIRQYKSFKINILFTPQKNIFNPVKIQYKRINLLFKHRPIAYFFAEVNYKTLEYTLIADVDFLFFPYKTLFDFKTLSLGD